MADYAKKKNDELAALCKERGLSHTGKKADLVKRLEDHDNTKSGEQAESDAPQPVSVNETSDAQSSTAKKQSTEQTSEKPDQQTQSTAEAAAAAAAADDSSEAKPTNATNGDKADTQNDTPAENFSLGLAERTLEEEIEKRKKRAAKFGLDISNDETLKQLERAKRFGTTDLPGLLNQALPERTERNKKRGREENKDKDSRKRSRQRTEEKPAEKIAPKNGSNGTHPSWMTDADREKAEKRKARFEKT